MDERITLIFDGGMASYGRLDLYDASTSMLGAARVFSILGHYYQTGRIISKAPKSLADVYIEPAEDGSFRQQIIIGVTTAMITAPFTIFAERIFDNWFPKPNDEMQQVIDLLREQNKILKGQQKVSEKKDAIEREQKRSVDQFIEGHATEIHVIRSIVAKSTKDMFRPVGRSAEYLAITRGSQRHPISALGVEGVRQLEYSIQDEKVSTVVGVVNAFSRSSKSGALFSPELERGMLFSYDHQGTLPAGDDFSWSQYTRRPLEFRGRYERFFDGSVKRFWVHQTNRVEAGEPSEVARADIFDFD
ncbi:hypothetical protein [Azospirillum soli]|uniref:DUF7946 domain-containing protein n=1 Tax=Azospirillum soli TaxID=1304799 RepID=UPI001AE97CE1|nr:hypothetical protein [Azospirillum soli]MBP2312430.1 hypothetical protein [Azospirillum soli]